jgi:hypothetical protein
MIQIKKEGAGVAAAGTVRGRFFGRGKIIPGIEGFTLTQLFQKSGLKN